MCQCRFVIVINELFRCQMLTSRAGVEQEIKQKSLCLLFQSANLELLEKLKSIKEKFLRNNRSV